MCYWEELALEGARAAAADLPSTWMTVQATCMDPHKCGCSWRGRITVRSADGNATCDACPQCGGHSFTGPIHTVMKLRQTMAQVAAVAGADGQLNGRAEADRSPIRASPLMDFMREHATSPEASTTEARPEASPEKSSPQRRWLRQRTVRSLVEDVQWKLADERANASIMDRGRWPRESIRTLSCGLHGALGSGTLGDAAAAVLQHLLANPVEEALRVMEAVFELGLIAGGITERHGDKEEER